MVTADYIRVILDYNYAMHRRIWDSIRHLSDAQFVEPVPYSIGSIRNHMVHLTSVDNRWLARCKNNPLPDRLQADDFPTAQAARAKYNEIEKQVLDYAATLDDNIIQQLIHMELTHRNVVSEKAIWQILVHIANHGTDHRAQILPILHGMGAPTFEQDLMNYWWDTEK